MLPLFESPVSLLLLAALAAYLLGSIPFGILVTRLLGLGDIRRIGSGNIGATNVLRTGSKPAALATVLLDGGKGFVSVIGARALVGEDAAQVAALFSFLGHLFPIWLGFRGGKGVATLLGAIVGLSPLLGLVTLLTWLFTYFVYRISSLAALMAAPLTILVAYLTDGRSMVVLLIIMAALMYWKHWQNIKRLIDGTEPTTGWSQK